MRPSGPNDRSAPSRRQVAVGLPLLAAGCATPRRLAAVPAAQTAQAEVAIPRARYFPERDTAPMIQLFYESVDKEAAWLKQSGHTGPLPPSSVLLVSGGGGDGAFGAGLLAGWTERGDRPSFRLVTGISTGALIAPFAYLGPKYDPMLRECYTRTTDRDIFKKRFFTAALWNDAVANTAPMAKLIERYVTRELLDEIAAEYAKGRLLMVGTTNLDAREPVYWDMGAIATSRQPEALQLFHKITLASASIPGAFPPVMIDVTLGGQRHQEMHVDGGATRQVFLYPPTIHLGELAAANQLERQRALYVIRNSRLDPDWASVDRRTLSIVGRSISALIQTQGVGDLITIYLTARRDGIDYNMAAIPPTFTLQKKSEFDVDYMTPLFETGHSMAAAGYPWAKFPPGYDPREAATAARPPG